MPAFKKNDLGGITLEMNERESVVLTAILGALSGKIQDSDDSLYMLFPHFDDMADVLEYEIWPSDGDDGYPLHQMYEKRKELGIPDMRLVDLHWRFNQDDVLELNEKAKNS